MTSSRYKYIFFFMLLIGLNFFGLAVVLSYVLVLYVALGIRVTRKIPCNFIIVILLVLSILCSMFVFEENNILLQIIKMGTYVCIYLTFYFLAIDSTKQLANKDEVVNIFANCIFYFSLGNMMHLVFNIYITDINSIDLGYRVLNDFWSGDTTPTTIIIGWGCFLLPVLIYYLDIFKLSKIKFFLSLVLLVFYLAFSFRIATRLGIVNAILILGVCYVIKIHQKEIKISVSTIFKGMIVFVGIIIASVRLLPIILKSNLAVRMAGESISLFSGNGRLEASLYLLQHWSEALMGGSYFTNQYGLQQHNMLLQIYDLYGIIPFVILFCVFVLALKNIYLVYKCNKLNNVSKRFCVLFGFALFIYLFEEPAFSSNFIITVMIFGWIAFSTVLVRVG